ncbi:MAG: IS110 family transposase, partial [Deltaproteobacteria bacterium]
EQRTHLHGVRGQAFAAQIRGIPRERILCVSLDVSKYFHVVMIHNGLGEIVRPPFEIDIYQSGFDQLQHVIAQAQAEIQAEVVLIGMEPTGHYFENLARQLVAHGRPVTLINSYAVKSNRHQQLMQRQKSDEIDVAAIGDLLQRGQGTPYRPLTGVYLALQQIDRHRLALVRSQTRLKNRIIGHMDRIFPGLVLTNKAAQERYTPLFKTDFWKCQTLQHLIRICPNPHQILAMSPKELAEAFRQHGGRMGPATAARILEQAQKTLLPDPELAAVRSQCLQSDLALLESIETQIAELENMETKLVEQTPYQVWTTLKGLSTVQAASLAAAIGPPENYCHVGQIVRRAGLVPSCHDSGTYQRKGKGGHITKVGDAFLRRALMNATNSLLMHQPVLARYFHKKMRDKEPPVAKVATARKALSILWATLRDGYSSTLIAQESSS